MHVVQQTLGVVEEHKSEWWYDNMANGSKGSYSRCDIMWTVGSCLSYLHLGMVHTAHVFTFRCTV